MIMKKDKNKKLQKAEKKETSIVRSSAAEYLTFVAATGEGGVEAVYADENIWLSQKMMGVLYDVNVRTVNEHLKKNLCRQRVAEKFSCPEIPDNCRRWQELQHLAL
jgi:hypothetical protein